MNKVAVVQKKTNQVAAANVSEKRKLIEIMADRYEMDADVFQRTVRSICLRPPSKGPDYSNEEFAAFLMAANNHGLNPILREIFGFRDSRGNMCVVVSVDGWMNIINSHPAMDGMEFDDHADDDGNLIAISCRIWRKDRAHPVVVTEYMAECERGSEPWKQWPRRMLRHKATIQAARYAFGFAGIVDPDEAERMGVDISPMQDITPRGQTTIDGLQGRLKDAGHAPQGVSARVHDEIAQLGIKPDEAQPEDAPEEEQPADTAENESGDAESPVDGDGAGDAVPQPSNQADAPAPDPEPGDAPSPLIALAKEMAGAEDTSNLDQTLDQFERSASKGDKEAARAVYSAHYKRLNGKLSLEQCDEAVTALMKGVEQ